MAGVYRSNQDNAAPVRHLGPYRPWAWHKARGGDGSNYDPYSRRILDFKDGKPDAILEFSQKIEPLLGQDFSVCVVPSHEPEKKTGALHQLTAALCGNKNRVDASACLVRHKKIPKLAAGGSRDKQVHLDSIRVVQPRLISKRNVLLLDDVMTSGNSFEACKELLLQAGAANVWCLALGRTE